MVIGKNQVPKANSFLLKTKAKQMFQAKATKAGKRND